MPELFGDAAASALWQAIEDSIANDKSENPKLLIPSASSSHRYKDAWHHERGQAYGARSCMFTGDACLKDPTTERILIAQNQSPFFKPPKRTTRWVKSETQIMERGRGNSTVCVTGGGGYIGSWLVRDLLLQGYYVNATFRDPGNESKTRHILSLPGARERLTLFKADINEVGSFDSAVHGCDFVIHTATPADYTKDPEIGVIQATVNGTLDILRACTKAKSVRRVIYTSSLTAASPLKDKGEFRDRIDESCWTNVDLIRREKTLFGIYCVSKTLAEQAALQYGSDHGIEVVTIVPSMVAGPFLTPTIPVSVSTTLSLITGNEELCRNLKEIQYVQGSVALVHIEDLCRAHIFVMEHPSAKGRYICSSEALSIHEMGNFCRKRYPQFSQPDRFHDAEALNGVPISSKKLLDLGFSYQYGLPQIFDESIEFAEKIGSLQ